MWFCCRSDWTLRALDAHSNILILVNILCTSTLQKKKKIHFCKHSEHSVFSHQGKKKNLTKWLDDRISWEYPVNQASAGHSAVLKPAGKSRCEPSNFTYSSSEVNETPAVLCLSLLALIEATQFCLGWCWRYDTLNIVFYCEQRDKFNLDEKKR